MKVFHLLFFHGSFIFPECILLFGLILLRVDSTSDQKDRPWFYFISSNRICNRWNSCWRLKWWICKHDHLYAVLYLHESRNFCLHCILWSTHRNWSHSRLCRIIQYTKDPFFALSSALCLLSLGSCLPPLAGFFGKIYLFWCGWQTYISFLGFNRTPYEPCFYLLLSTNHQVINDWTKPRNHPTPHVRNDRRSTFRSNNSIEWSMTCMCDSIYYTRNINERTQFLQLLGIPFFSF